MMTVVVYKFIYFFIEILSDEDLGVDCLLGIYFLLEG